LAMAHRRRPWGRSPQAPVAGSLTNCAAGACCTRRRRNAHGTEVREVLYAWHPWSGRQVHVHEAVERIGVEVFRCSSTGSMSDRLLEIPVWMFDRTICARVRTGDTPQASIGALDALVRLLEAVQPVSVAPAHGAASSPH